MSIEYAENVSQKLEYFTIEFYQEVMEYALRKANFNINSVHISMGSSVGDNYLSSIYRIKVNYEVIDNSDDTKNDINNNQSISLILKSMPDGPRDEFLKGLTVFLKEKITYYDVLPRMEILLENGKKLAPRLFHCMSKPVKTFIFEDLKDSNYEMVSRETGLDLAHAQLALARIAEFHAASMLLAEKDAEIMKFYHTGKFSKTSHFEDDDSRVLHHFVITIDAMSDVIETWQGYEKIAGKIRKFLGNFRQHAARCQAPQAGDMLVLNHGDPWVNNMLFQYNAQRQVQNVIFVDYQMCVWSSPGVDLNYFLYTSIQLELLMHKRELLLRGYHEQLCATLRRINYSKELPTFEQILREVQQRETFGFLVNVVFFPIICQDKQMSKNSIVENYLNVDFTRNKMKSVYCTKRIQEILRYTLKHFDEIGIWD